MNSREISQLFNQNDSEQFNPIQTFGNRQSISNTQSNGKLKIKHNFHLQQQSKNGIEHQQQANERETRIKLLTSYQQSYLESVSQPMFTQQDQPSQCSRIHTKYNNLSYSDSKGLSQKQQKYLFTDPGEEINKKQQIKTRKTKITNYDREFQQQRGQNDKHSQTKSIFKDLQEQMSKKIQEQRNNITVLQQAIDQQIYSLNVQQRLYQFLMRRIQSRGKQRKLKDNHQIIEKAIDFMDSGQQFMKQFIKLKRMANNS